MDASVPRSIPAAKLRWLRDESASWETQRILSPDARQRLLASYQAASPHAHGMLALLLLAALMTGIGVLLLIGYNWDRISSAAKIAILAGSVGFSFGASAFAAARGRQAVAHTLAVLGTLLFGNAIWLIAQVLHMPIEFSDGFLWWSAGTLVCAWLLGSVPIGVEAAVLILCWTFVAGADNAPERLLTFALIAPAAVALAYRLRSAPLLLAMLLAVVVWVATLPSIELVQTFGGSVVAVGVLAAVGALFHALGSLGRDGRLPRVWRTTGLMVLLVCATVLMIRDVQEYAFYRTISATELFPILTLQRRALLPAAIAAAATIAVTGLRLRWTTNAAAIAVWSVAPVLWIAAATATRTDGLHPAAATLGFSALTLALSVALIRSAARLDRTSDLVFGVLFGLSFVLVRWLSLIDSMLWSGLLLIATAAGLFMVARLWQQRARTAGSLA